MERSRQERNQPQAPTPHLREKPTLRPQNKEGRQDKDGTRREQGRGAPPLSLLLHQFIRGSPAALLVVRDWRSVILFVARKGARVRAQMKDAGFDNSSSACERVVCLSSKGSRGQGSRPESMLHIRRASAGPANEGLVGFPPHLAEGHAAEALDDGRHPMFPSIDALKITETPAWKRA